MKRTSEGDAYKKNNPEAFAKLARAMELSHGKSDTPLARELAKIPAATAEDIVRLHKEDDRNIYGSRDVWHKKEERGEQLRYRHTKEAYRYCFKETFAYRYLEKLGIAQKLVEKEDLKRAVEVKGIVVCRTHDCDCAEFNPNARNVDGKFLVKAYNPQYNELAVEFSTVIQTPASIREKIFKDDFLLDVWTSGRKVLCDYPYWAIEGGYKWTEEQLKAMSKEYRRKQNEKKAEELLMLNNAPQDIKDTILGYINADKEKQNKARECGNHYVRSYEFRALSEIWYNNTRLEPWKIEKELELEDFYKALEYMGLGIVCLQKEHIYEKKNIRQFVSHVNATTRQFVSDIKKGFDAATVRMMVAEDLNLWLKKRVQDKWTVFVRQDAPKDYPDIEVKKKKKPSLKEEAKMVTGSEAGLLDYIKQYSTLKGE